LRTQSGDLTTKIYEKDKALASFTELNTNFNGTVSRMKALEEQVKILELENARLKSKYRENDIELHARLFFMKVLHMLTSKYSITWNLLGDFLRLFLSDLSCSSSSMIIHLRPMRTYTFFQNNVTDFFKDLNILGIVIKSTKQSVTQNNYEIRIMYEEIPVTFLVMFRTDIDINPICSIDALTLTPTGLTLTKRDPFLDDNNLNNGIATLDRLIELRTKKIYLVKTFCNGANIHHVRSTNATLMRDQHQKQVEGFTFLPGMYGALQSCVDYKEDCPICMTNNNVFTTLSCGHTFCMLCLATHMDKKGDNHGKCPLCRGEILLYVI
jgi:hypothetical protein